MSAPLIDPGQAPSTPARPRRRWTMVAAAVGGTALLAGATVAAASAWADDPGYGTGGYGYDGESADGPGRGGPGGAPGGGPGRGGPGFLLEGEFGAVTALTDDTLTVATDAGGTETYTLTADTEVGSGPGAGQDEDLAVGQRVSVLAEDGTATAVRIVHAHVMGTVTAVTGDELTVVEREGFVVTVVAGSDVDLSAVAVGDSVHASGTVDDDGRTLLADEVTEGEPGRGDFPPDPDGGLPATEDGGTPTPPGEDGTTPPAPGEDGTTSPAPGEEPAPTTPSPDSDD